MAKILVQNTNITIISVNGDDYMSLTDLARLIKLNQIAIHQMSVLESN